MHSCPKRAFRANRVPLVCAYLYGSLARSDERPESDVDVAVLLAENTDGGLLSPIVRGRRMFGGPGGVHGLTRNAQSGEDAG